jgi:hypothetical protein
VTATQRHRRVRGVCVVRSCPQSVHWMSTFGATVWGGCPHVVEAVFARRVPTVSRMSQTPLYDQLRDERLNADVAASDRDGSAPEGQQEPRGSSGLRPVPGGGPGAVAVRGVCSGPDADLRVKAECFGRHRRHPEVEEVSDLHGGARRARRLSAQAADGGSREKATVPTAPTPVPAEPGGTRRS